MKRTHCSVLLFLTFSLWGSLQSQTTPKETFTLEECLARSLQKNALLHASLQHYQASLARINQAKSLPQPTLSWDSDLQPKFFNFKDAGEWYFGLSQPIAFPGKTYLKGKIASKESDEIKQEIEMLKLDIALQVKHSFFSLLAAQEKLKYIEQNFNLSKDFLKKTELKYRTGDVTKVEILRANVELAKVSNTLKKTQNEIRLAKAHLNFLMSRRKYAPLSVTGELKTKPMTLTLDTLKEQALSSRPEMKKINYSLEKEALQKKQAYWDYFPDLELGLNRHHIQGQGSWWDVTLSFPVPLFFWQPIKGKIAETKAKIKGLEKESEHMQNFILLEVEEAYANAQTAENQIRLFEEEILTQAEEVYSMYLLSYQEGEIGGMELIDARRTLIESHFSYVDSLLNYRMALAALEKSIGKTQ